MLLLTQPSLCRVASPHRTRSTQNPEWDRPKGGACLGEKPQESWEISHFATRAGGVQGIRSTPEDLRVVTLVFVPGPQVTCRIP